MFTVVVVGGGGGNGGRTMEVVVVMVVDWGGHGAEKCGCLEVIGLPEQGIEEAGTMTQILCWQTAFCPAKVATLAVLVGRAGDRRRGRRACWMRRARSGDADSLLANCGVFITSLAISISAAVERNTDEGGGGEGTQMLFWQMVLGPWPA